MKPSSRSPSNPGAGESLKANTANLSGSTKPFRKSGYFRALPGTVPTLFLDAPAARLDGERLERFIEQVARFRCQLVVTSLHAESRLFGPQERTFHMEDGRVQSV